MSASSDGESFSKYGAPRVFALMPFAAEFDEVYAAIKAAAISTADLT
jgi:hypothetical protein